MLKITDYPDPDPDPRKTIWMRTKRYSKNNFYLHPPYWKSGSCGEYEFDAFDGITLNAEYVHSPY